MRTLFVHQNFPAQYRHVAPALARRPGTQVIALGENAAEPLPGVQHLRYKAPPTGAANGVTTGVTTGVTAGAEGTHRYLRRLENATFRGQQVARAALTLKERGFTPDVLCCHPGWGEGLFLRDVWPDARMLFYYEYYYTSSGGDVGFDPPGAPVPIDEACRVRMLNANHLLCLQVSDWGHTATRWQASRFPDWARDRLSVVHEGVDTEVIHRLPEPEFTLPNGAVLRPGDEVVTFIGRGLEPYRGFPSFMRALPAILEQRPAAQVVIVGGDDPHYGSKPREGGTWREILLAELGERLDLSRVHFTGKIPHPALQAVLSLSTAHVYLTYPFVLSWSMLEAMANEALVIGSATAPVQEVIEDGVNGLLVDFHAPDQIAATVVKALARPEAYRDLRRAARRTIVERYDLQRRCLPDLLDLIDDVAAGRRPVPDRGAGLPG